MKLNGSELVNISLILVELLQQVEKSIVAVTVLKSSRKCLIKGAFLRWNSKIELYIRNSVIRHLRYVLANQVGILDNMKYVRILINTSQWLIEGFTKYKSLKDKQSYNTIVAPTILNPSPYET